MDTYTDTEEVLTCEACEEEVTYNDCHPGQDGTPYHDECWAQEFDYASTVWIIDGPHEPYKVLACSHGIYDAQYLEDYSGALQITRTYHRTDGWRGYYETRISGLQEVDSGWTTGDWGDAISNSKRDFNTWATDLIEGNTFLPEGLIVVLAFDPTSNVFSTACGVFTNDEEMFRQALEIPAGL